MKRCSTKGDGADGSKPVIATVMRQGYRLGDQVLRHALVGVVDTVASDGEGAMAPEPADPADPDDNADESR